MPHTGLHRGDVLALQRSEGPARDRSEMGGGEVGSRGPLANLAAVAADERLGSFEATTLAGGACASQLHMRKGSPTYQQAA